MAIGHNRLLGLALIPSSVSLAAHLDEGLCVFDCVNNACAPQQQQQHLTQQLDGGVLLVSPLIYRLLTRPRRLPVWSPMRGEDARTRLVRKQT